MDRGRIGSQEAHFGRSDTVSAAGNHFGRTNDRGWL